MTTDVMDLLHRIPRENADRDFLVDTIGGRSLTFGALHESAVRIGADLRRRGLERGDRVAMLMHNSAAFAELYLGCLYAGVVAVPINPVFSRSEIGFILESTRARLVFVSPETADQVADAGGDARTLSLQADGEPPPGAERWHPDGLDEAAGFEPLEGAVPDDTLCIVYTSGTTSQPKGVVHSVGNMLGNGHAFGRRLGIGPGNRFYGILAMTYLGGYYNLLMLPYVNASSVALARTFDASAALDFWTPAREAGVNTLWLVPTIASILMEMDRGTDGERFCRDEVDLALVGTAPLTASQRRAFEERYGVTLYENYGLSETFFISTNAPTLPLVEGSVGRLMPGVQVTILGGDGRAREYGEEGEVAVSTPYLMNGYFDAGRDGPEPPAEAWFRTGDIGVLTGAGDLFITGREKDLIIRGGINISPAAIEDVLTEHDAVVDCAVVGIPHALYGEAVAAVVRLGGGRSLETVRPELERLCRDALSPVKQPAHFLELDEFPRSSSNKIQKAKVRELVVHKLGLTHLADGAAAPAKRRSLPGRVRQSVTRPAPELVARLREHPVSILSDCMNRLGTMDAGIRPLVRGRAFAGPALTVEEVEGGNLMSHAALELVQPGDVLVIDAKGVTTRACWGGLQTLMAKQRGIAAIVVNGAVRDYQDVVELEVPVYARGLSPAGPLKGWAGNVNHPVACGGVVVGPGDIVVGDDDGIAVVPPALAEAVLECAAGRGRLEEEWFERVRAGESTLDVVGLRKLLEEYGVIYE